MAYILRNLEVAFLTNNLKFTYIDIYFNIILNELSKCFYSFPQGRKDCSSVIERIAKEKSQIASHLGHKSCIIKKAILMTDISTLPQPCSSKVGTSPSSPKPPPDPRHVRTNQSSMNFYAKILTATIDIVTWEENLIWAKPVMLSYTWP